MAFKRYKCVADNSITNAYYPNMLYRATGSNCGGADSLQVFHIFGQQSTSSHEVSRILLKFPIESISNDVSLGKVPSSGSCKYFLKLYNAVHPFTLPRNFTLNIQPVSSSWDEGEGMDMDDFIDYGYCNWNNRQSSSYGVFDWSTPGGDFLTSNTASVFFEKGNEDIEVDITDLVEKWKSQTIDNNGITIKLTDHLETAFSSSYIKKFYSRSSEYFFLQPTLEARWDDCIKDKRSSFFASSSLATEQDNKNTLVFYNRIRGKLVDIPGYSSGSNIFLKIYTDRAAGVCLTNTPISASWVKTGIYTASFVLDTSASYVYDRWYNSNLLTCFYTGSEIQVLTQENYEYNNNSDYKISMPGLKDEYDKKETVLFRIFTQKDDRNYNLYNVMTEEQDIDVVEDMFYSVRRVIDNFEVIPYGTGSLEYTKCSYDKSGSYFYLDMSNFESDYMYEFSFLAKQEQNNYKEFTDRFKFRVRK